MQYSHMAEYYDAIYNFKMYEEEVTILRTLINPYLKSGNKILLDVACGTGKHLKYLQKHFTCEGLDICPELLGIARKKLPKVIFHLANMTNFKLEKKYDVITCFFGSIGHVKTVGMLYRTIRNFKKHLKPNGILVIEPWHTPEQFKAGRTNLLTVDEPDLKIARCCTSQVKDGMSILDMHHLICTAEGTKHFVEKLRLGLFEEKDYLQALSEYGFTVQHEKLRGNGNGVYLAYNQ
jgi:ubiquinone/menaquinone biosynthesis C-methylase UbiE